MEIQHHCLQKTIKFQRVDQQNIPASRLYFLDTYYDDSFSFIQQNETWFSNQTKFIDQLSEEDKSVLMEYTLSTKYVKFNKEKETQLNRIILSSPPLSSPLMVWIGDSLRQNAFQSSILKLHDHLHVGDIYLFTTVRSTTIDFRTALNYAGSNKGFLTRLLLPPGFRCLWLFPITAFKGTEFEILLPSYLYYMVTKIHTLSFDMKMREKGQTRLFTKPCYDVMLANYYTKDNYNYQTPEQLQSFMRQKKQKKQSMALAKYKTII